MNKHLVAFVAAVAVAFLASVALAEEILITTVTGTTAQTAIVGPGRKVCIYCTTDVRYTAGTSTTIKAATTSNSAVVPTGDCYRIQLQGGNDRLSIIHKDGATSFSCDVHAVVP